MTIFTLHGSVSFDSFSLLFMLRTLVQVARTPGEEGMEKITEFVQQLDLYLALKKPFHLVSAVALVGTGKAYNEASG